MSRARSVLRQVYLERCASCGTDVSPDPQLLLWIEEGRLDELTVPPSIVSGAVESAALPLIAFLDAALPICPLKRISVRGCSLRASELRSLFRGLSECRSVAVVDLAGNTMTPLLWGDLLAAVRLSPWITRIIVQSKEGCPHTEESSIIKTLDDEPPLLASQGPSIVVDDLDGRGKPSQPQTTSGASLSAVDSDTVDVSSTLSALQLVVQHSDHVTGPFFFFTFCSLKEFCVTQLQTVRRDKTLTEGIIERISTLAQAFSVWRHVTMPKGPQEAPHRLKQQPEDDANEQQGSCVICGCAALLSVQPANWHCVITAVCENGLEKHRWATAPRLSYVLTLCTYIADRCQCPPGAPSWETQGPWLCSTKCARLFGKSALWEAAGIASGALKHATPTTHSVKPPVPVCFIHQVMPNLAKKSSRGMPQQEIKTAMLPTYNAAVAAAQQQDQVQLPVGDRSVTQALGYVISQRIHEPVSTAFLYMSMKRCFGERWGQTLHAACTTALNAGVLPLRRATEDQLPDVAIAYRPPLCIAFVNHKQQLLDAAAPFDAMVQYLTERSYPLGCRPTPLLLGIKFRTKWSRITSPSKEGSPPQELTLLENQDPNECASGHIGKAAVAIGVTTRGGSLRILAWMDGNIYALHSSVVNEGALRYGAYAFVDLPIDLHTAAIQRVSGAPVIARSIPSFPALLTEVPPAYIEVFLRVLLAMGRAHGDHASDHTAAFHKYDECLFRIVRDAIDANPQALAALDTKAARNLIRMYRAGHTTAATMWWWTLAPPQLVQCAISASKRLYAANYSELFPTWTAEPLFPDSPNFHESQKVQHRPFFPRPGTTITVNGAVEGEAIQLLLPTEQQPAPVTLRFSQLWESSALSPHGLYPFILLDSSHPIPMCRAEILMEKIFAVGIPGAPPTLAARWEVSHSDDNKLFTILPSCGEWDYDSQSPDSDSHRVVISFGAVGAHRFWRLRFFNLTKAGEIAEASKGPSPTVHSVAWSFMSESLPRRCCFHYRDEVICYVVGHVLSLIDIRTAELKGRPNLLGADWAHGIPFRTIDAVILLEAIGQLLVVSDGRAISVDKWSGQVRSCVLRCSEHPLMRHMPEPFCSYLDAAWPLDLHAQLLFSGPFFCVFDFTVFRMLIPPSPIQSLPGRPLTEFDKDGNLTNMRVSSDPQYSFPFDQVDLCFPMPPPAVQGKLVPTSFYHLVMIRHGRFLRWELPAKERLSTLYRDVRDTCFGALLPCAPTQPLCGSLLHHFQLKIDVASELRESRRILQQKLRTAIQPIDLTDESISVQSTHTIEAVGAASIRALFLEEDSIVVDFESGFHGSTEGMAFDVSFPAPRIVSGIEVIADAVGTVWTLQYQSNPNGRWNDAASCSQSKLVANAMSSSTIPSSSWRITSNRTTVGRLLKIFLLQSSRRYWGPSNFADFVTVEVTRQHIFLPELKSRRIGAVLCDCSFESPTLIAGVDVLCPFPFTNGCENTDALEFRFRRGLGEWCCLLDGRHAAPLSQRCNEVEPGPSSSLQIRWAPKQLTQCEVIAGPGFPSSLRSFDLSWRVVPSRQLKLVNDPCTPPAATETILLLDAPSYSLWRCSIAFSEESSFDRAITLCYSSPTSNETYIACASIACGGQHAEMLWDPIPAAIIRLKLGVLPPCTISSVKLFEAQVPFVAATSEIRKPALKPFALFQPNCLDSAYSSSLAEEVHTATSFEPFQLVVELPRALLASTMIQGLRLHAAVHGARNFAVSTRRSEFEAFSSKAVDSASSDFRWALQPVHSIEVVHDQDAVVHTKGIQLFSDSCSMFMPDSSMQLKVCHAGRSVVIPSAAHFGGPIPIEMGTTLNYQAADLPISYVGIVIKCSSQNAEFSLSYSDDDSSYVTIGECTAKAGAHWPYCGPHRYWRLRCVQTSTDDVLYVRSIEWLFPSPCMPSEPFAITRTVGLLTTNAWIVVGKDIYDAHSMEEMPEAVLRFSPQPDAKSGGGKSGKASSTGSSVASAVLYVALDLFSGPQPFIRLGIRTDQPPGHELTVQFSDDNENFTSVAVHQQDDILCFSSWDWCGAHRFWRVVVPTMPAIGRRSRRSVSSHEDSSDQDEALLEAILSQKMIAEECGYLNLTWFVPAQRPAFPLPAETVNLIEIARKTSPSLVPDADVCYTHSMPIGGGLLKRKITTTSPRMMSSTTGATDLAVARATFGKVSSAAFRAASKLEEQLDELLPDIQSPEGLFENGVEMLKALFFPDSILVIAGADVKTIAHRYTLSPIVCVRGVLGKPCLALPGGTHICLAVDWPFSSLEKTVSSCKPSAIIVAVLSTSVQNYFPTLRQFAQLITLPEAPREWFVCFSKVGHIFGGRQQPLYHPDKKERAARYEIHLPGGISFVSTMTGTELDDLIRGTEASRLIAALCDVRSLTEVEVSFSLPTVPRMEDPELVVNFVCPVALVDESVSIPELRFVFRCSRSGVQIECIGAAVFGFLPGRECIVTSILHGVHTTDSVQFGATIPQTIPLQGTPFSVSHCIGTFDLNIRRRRFENFVFSGCFWLAPMICASCQMVSGDKHLELKASLEHFCRADFLSVVQAVTDRKAATQLNDSLPFDLSFSYVKLFVHVPPQLLAPNDTTASNGSNPLSSLEINGESLCYMFGNSGGASLNFKCDRVRVLGNFGVFNLADSLHCAPGSVEIEANSDEGKPPTCRLLTYVHRSGMVTDDTAVVDFSTRAFRASGLLFGKLGFEASGILDGPPSASPKISNAEWTVAPDASNMLLLRLRQSSLFSAKIDFASLCISKVGIWNGRPLNEQMTVKVVGSLHGCPFDIALPVTAWELLSPRQQGVCNFDQFCEELLSSIVGCCEVSILMAHTEPPGSTKASR